MKSNEETRAAHERGYMEGSRGAKLLMLQQLLTGLGPGARTQADWIVERQETIAALREVCEDFGDNDWPDNLSLSDVIQKHLAPHLHEAESAKVTR
jgi:hypothetical protein